MKTKSAGRLACFLFVLGVAGMGQAAIVQWASNGHYYDAIAFPSGITWQDAKAHAESLQYSGMNGHLATVTSMAENAFIVNNFGGANALNGYFLGGFQPAGSTEPAGNWQWITGETWSFTNWDSAEPNNGYSGGAIFYSQPTLTDEEVLHYYHFNGQWNDVPLMSGWGGLIVEYEPSPVPIPSAVWILGSGLAGILALKRFKKE